MKSKEINKKTKYVVLSLVLALAALATISEIAFVTTPNGSTIQKVFAMRMDPHCIVSGPDTYNAGPYGCS